MKNLAAVKCAKKEKKEIQSINTTISIMKLVSIERGRRRMLPPETMSDRSSFKAQKHNGKYRKIISNDVISYWIEATTQTTRWRAWCWSKTIGEPFWTKNQEEIVWMSGPGNKSSSIISFGFGFGLRLVCVSLLSQQNRSTNKDTKLELGVSRCCWDIESIMWWWLINRDTWAK